MPAAALAALAAGGKVCGGQNEQAGLGIGVAGLACGYRRRVYGENLGTSRVIGRQPRPCRLGERSVR